MTALRVNGEEHVLEADPDMPVLWALRDILDLTGTKYGCGLGLCGACTILLDGAPVRSCSIRLGDAEGVEITTVEGATDHVSRVVKDAWREVGVVQCGYCQSGQILSAIALLKAAPDPSPSEIEAAMDPILCRCGTYTRITTAIRLAGKRLSG